MKNIISKLKTMGDTQSKQRRSNIPQTRRSSTDSPYLSRHHKSVEKKNRESTQSAGLRHEDVARATSKSRSRPLQHRRNTIDMSSPFKNGFQENKNDGFAQETNEPGHAAASQPRHPHNSLQQQQAHATEVPHTIDTSLKHIDKLSKEVEKSDLKYHIPIGKKQLKSKAKALKKKELRQIAANKKTKTPKKRTSFFKRAFHFRNKTRKSLNRANMDIVSIEEEKGQAHVGVDKAPWNSKKRVILSPRNANYTVGGGNQEKQFKIGSFWGDDQPSPEVYGPYGNRKPRESHISHGIAPLPRVSIGTHQKPDNGLRMDQIITVTSTLSTNFTHDRVASTPVGGAIVGSRSAISVLFEGDERSVASNETPIPPETPTDHDYLAEYDQEEQRQLMQAPSDDTSCASEAGSRRVLTHSHDSINSGRSHISMSNTTKRSSSNSSMLAKYLLTQRNNPEPTAKVGVSGASTVKSAASWGSTCSSLPASWARPSTGTAPIRERLSLPLENTKKQFRKLGIDCSYGLSNLEEISGDMLSPIAKCESIRECESQCQESDQSLFSIADSATKSIVAASLCKGSFREAITDTDAVAMDVSSNTETLKVEEKEITEKVPITTITSSSKELEPEQDETKTGGQDYSPRAFAPKGSAFGVRLKRVATPARISTNVCLIGDGVFPGASDATDEAKKEMLNHLPLSPVTSPPTPTNARSPRNAFDIFPVLQASDEENKTTGGRGLKIFSKRLSFKKLKRLSPVKKTPATKYVPPKATKGLVAQRVNLFNERVSNHSNDASLPIETLQNGRLRRNRVVTANQSRRDTGGEGALAPGQPTLEVTGDKKASSVVSIAETKEDIQSTNLAESREVVSNCEVLASLQEGEEEAEEEIEKEHDHQNNSVPSANIPEDNSANIIDLHNGRLRRNRVVTANQSRRDTGGVGALAPRQPKLESPLFPRKMLITQDTKDAPVACIEETKEDTQSTKLAESREVVSNREVLASLQEDEEESEEETEHEHDHKTRSVLSANTPEENSASIDDSARSIEENAESESNGFERKPDAASVVILAESVPEAKETVEEQAAADVAVNIVEEEKPEVFHSQSVDSMESTCLIDELTEHIGELQIEQKTVHQDEIVDGQENHLPDEDDVATDYDISSSLQESSSASTDDFALVFANTRSGNINNSNSNSYGEGDSFYEDDQVIVGSSSVSPFFQRDSDGEESYGGEEHDAISIAIIGAPSLSTPRNQILCSMSVSPIQETPKAHFERGTGTKNRGTDTFKTVTSVSPLQPRRGNSSTSILSAYKKDSGRAIFTPPPFGVEQGIADKENSPCMMQMQTQNANSPFASPPMAMKESSTNVNPRQMNPRGKPAESLCLSPTQRTPAQASRWRQKAAKYSAANSSTKKKGVKKIGKGRLSIDIMLTGL